MSQPDDGKRNSKSAHEQSIAISILVLISNDTSDGEGRDQGDRGHRAGRYDRPPVLSGA